MYSTFDTYNPTKEDLIKHAPEGATHYNPEDEDWYLTFWRCQDGIWLHKPLNFGDWLDSQSEDAYGMFQSGFIKPIEQAVSPVEENPTTIRERILEIRKEREAGINEEQDLIDKLASMGFKLIEEINEKLQEAKEQHDLQDWRNWQEGDFITFISNSITDSFTLGKIYEVDSIKDGHRNPVNIKEDDDGDRNGWKAEFFKFHSRPTK